MVPELNYRLFKLCLW